MSLRSNPAYRVLLIVLSLACLGGAGYLGYRMFAGPGTPESLIDKGTETYDKAVKAYEAKDYAKAAQWFDEAAIHANKARELVDAKAATTEGQTAEVRATLRPLAGKALWLRARAIRDREFARSALDGKPITDTTDTSTGETYRNFHAIPNAEARKTALEDLVVSAGHLDTNADVIKDALRTELVVQPERWQNIDRYCRALIAINPKDGRANYFLARIEFMQAGSGDKKSAERMRAAAEHIEAAKSATPPTPYWRTVFLESQILEWQVTDEAKRKSGQPEKVAGQLQQLIFNEKDGALAKAARGDHLDALSRYDVEGLFGIHMVATEMSIAEAARPGGDRSRLLQIARSATAVSKKVTDSRLGKAFASDATTAMVRMGMAFQSYADMKNPDWIAFFEQTDELAKSDQSGIKPTSADAYGRFVLREAFLAAQRGDRRKRAELLDDGIKVLTKAVSSGGAPHSLAETHSMLAQLKLLKGEPFEAIEPHIAGVRAGPNPRNKVDAQVLEGIALQRAGRLEKARIALEVVTENKEKEKEKLYPDLVFRANSNLIDIHMALGNPAAALTPLQRAEEWYNDFQKLPAEDKALMAEFIPPPDDLSAYIAMAHLETAAVAIRKALRDAPTKDPPPALYVAHEKAAQARMQRLKPPTTADRSARLGLANYLISTYRPDQAEVVLAALARDYPDSIEVLRSRLGLATAAKSPSAGPAPLNSVQIQAADKAIQDYLKVNQTSKQAKVLWAEWLRRTNRPHEAIKFLRDPANFPGGRDEAVEKLLASALIQVGEREEAKQVLAILGNTDIDVVVAGGFDHAKQQLQDAMAKTQNNGMLRVYAAAIKLREKDYEGAARGFASALDFVQARQPARTGLLRAIVAYSQTNAEKSRTLALTLSDELPDEPMLPLGAAAAALALEDLGTPNDSWVRSKSMGAALNEYDRLASKAGIARTEICSTKADLWLIAAKPEVASQEARRALQTDPKHLPSLLLLSNLALASGVKEEIAKVAGYVATMKEVAPDDTRVIMTEVRSQEALDDLTGAVRTIRITLAKNPKFPPGYPVLVALLDRQNDMAGAIDALKEWKNVFPQDPNLVVESIRILTKAGKSPEAKGVADQFVAERMAEAKKAADEIRVEGPMAATRARQKEELVRNAEAQANGLAASGFLRGKDYAEAESRLLKVLKAVPDSDPAILMLGDVYIAQSVWDKALVEYRKVLAKTPQHFIAGNNVAWILATHKNDAAGALKVVEDVRRGKDSKPIAAELLPAPFLDTIGSVYGRLNKPEKFVEMKDIFEAAIKKHPLDARMYMYLGEAQAALGDKSKATGNFDSAVRLAAPDVRNGLSDKDRETVIQTVAALRKKYQ